MYKHKVQSFKHCEKQRLTDQQLSSSIFPCCPVPSPIRDISNIWCFRPYKPYIFWKLLVQVYQNYQPIVLFTNTQIQIHKYTITQLQQISKCQKTPTCGILLKRALIKNYIPICWTRKYTNTNTQIYKYSIWWSTRKTQYVVYFWKEDCSRVSKMILSCVKRANTQIQIHKYTNRAYHKVPEIPNMWYIFEKRIVQRYQKWYSHVSNAQIQKYKYTNTQIHKYSIWQSAR